MKSILSVVLLFACCSLLSITQAHHSFRGVYDFSKHSTIKGEFVKLELLNPHARIFINVTNEGGETQQWMIEAPGKLSLARRGWTDDMFKQGEIITVVGNPSPTGKLAIWLEKITLEDGTEFIDPLIADNLAIEAERRARFQQAAEQE